MKSIMMSIRPNWVAKILNGEKTIEVRKKFPVDYVGWVYIYCTKDEYLICDLYTGKARYHNIPKGKNGFTSSGKVVARFWCDKVEEIKLPYTKFGTNEWVGCEAQRTLQTETMDEPILLEKSCLSEEEIYKYLNFKHSPNYCGTAIHITKLEIFDKPREISEFDIVKKHNNCSECPFINDEYDYSHCYTCEELKTLTKAPQNYCYIEGE